MNKKISVIVPVYNVEKYIEKCLDSLVNQTYDNLEIILVNDCSKDDSESIIKKYQKKYKNILYFKNEKNSGAAYSRNVALKKATGDYIGFIDSDDYVAENYYEGLMDSITKNKADIAICDINLIDEEKNSIFRSKCGSRDNNKEDFINQGLSASPCNKLFKKEALLYEFTPGMMNEDLAVILPSVIKAKKVVYNPDVTYNYVQRNASVQNSELSLKRFDIFPAVDETLSRIEDVKDYDDYKQMITFQQLFFLFLYVFTKEKKFFKRLKFFRLYYKRAKKYDMAHNKYVKKFVDESGKKHRLYFRAIIFFEYHGLCLMSNILVRVYDILRKLFYHQTIKENLGMDDLIKAAKAQSKMKKAPVSISVIVPNYNYDRFMYQRLYSILYQKVKIEELIILDDCSKDNSRKTIDKIVKELEKYIDIKKVYNETNSGSAFKQWEKGFGIAKSDYVWIAEADDYCTNKMLKNLIKPIKKDKDIIISYVDTAFIDADGAIQLRTITPEIDIRKTGHWSKNFINDGKDEILTYCFLNCTIANVSSCIIKNGDYSKELALSRTYKQAGDWLFYVNAMRRGKISFIAKPYNFYRVHGNNVSSVYDKEKHIKEILTIYEYFDKEFKLTKWHHEEQKKRIEFLKKVWDVK